ncbi:unnamed protein product [Periconia digitata]|uniref:Uncharacterized protein n=1 Tax=Periconia digitata TaxID=1303443 RepID=A0A9W4USI3_9PLEO|nr:unnamed protein product [Periconia digitata]
MSDYGDDSDYEYGAGDWFYVEEEYMPADDLAEHAVQSPPPTAYDEEMMEEWDRFDYFNDIEYASDGYDSATFETKNCPGDTKIGQKRKRRPATSPRPRKRHQPVQAPAIGQGDADMLTNAPVVWRSQADRDIAPKPWNGDTGSYALLKDWREKLADAPSLTPKSSQLATPASVAAHTPNINSSRLTESLLTATTVEPEGDDAGVEGDEGDEGGALDPAAILAVLQQRLAAEGGPLSGMNPEQVLQFAMRMANGEGADDDIAGEMADEMLENMLGAGDEDEEEDADAEANLRTWVSQQRNPSNTTPATNGDASTVNANHSPAEPSSLPPPPTRPPRKDANEDETMHGASAEADGANTQEEPSTAPSPPPVKGTRKRKAAPTDAGPATNTKRRATRSYQSSTAASQAKTVPATRTTRSTRSKR